jgi:uncharacterized ferritin-like protein (DUF455 family)
VTPLDPQLFAAAPARDARFDVKDRWIDCANFPDGTPEWQMEFFHRQMNEECNVLENAARHLVEFPEVEWELRMWLARQCYDEARHTIAYQRLLERRGGRVGAYPVLNFQYRILGTIPHLLGRLAVQNRSFEADGLDAATHALAEARRQGDAELAELFEQQQADEVLHIRFANDWIRRELARDPRNVLRMAAALTQGMKAFKWVFDSGGLRVDKYGVAEQERLEAGFEPHEVRVAVEKNRERIAAVRRGEV